MAVTRIPRPDRGRYDYLNFGKGTLPRLPGSTYPLNPLIPNSNPAQPIKMVPANSAAIGSRTRVAQAGPVEAGTGSLTAEEIEYLAYTLLGEARGEGTDGMYAVANVIRNRTESPYYPDSPVDVAGQDRQFSTNNAGEGGNQAATRREVPPGSDLYNSAVAIVSAVLEPGTDPVDLTGGALNYHATNIDPYWADAATTSWGTLDIGNHRFYARRPVPPMDIPTAVASALDVTPPRDLSPIEQLRAETRVQRRLANPDPDIMASPFIDGHLGTMYSPALVGDEAWYRDNPNGDEWATRDMVMPDGMTFDAIEMPALAWADIPARDTSRTRIEDAQARIQQAGIEHAATQARLRMIDQLQWSKATPETVALAAALSGDPMTEEQVDEVATSLADLPWVESSADDVGRFYEGTAASGNVTPPPPGVLSDEYTPSLPAGVKRVTPEGLNVREVQVYSVGADGQPIIFDAPLTPDRRAAVNAGRLSAAAGDAPGTLVGSVSSVSALRRVTAAKQTAARLAAAAASAQMAGASDARRAIAEAAGAADAKAALAAMPGTPIDVVDPMLSDIDVANLTRPRGPTGRGGKRGEQMSDARLVSPALIAPISGSDAAPYGFEGGLPGRLSDEYTAPRDMPAAPRIDPRTVPPAYIAPRLARSPALGTTTMNDVIDMSAVYGDRFGTRSAQKMLEGTPYEDLGADIDQHFGPPPASVPRETPPLPAPRPAKRATTTSGGGSTSGGVGRLSDEYTAPKKSPTVPAARTPATPSFVRPAGPAGSMPAAPAPSRTETIVTEFKKLNPEWSEPVKIDPLKLEQAEKAVTMGRYNPAHLKLLAARDAARNAPVVPKYITERRVEEVVVRGGNAAAAPAPATRRAVVRPAVTFQGTSSGKTYTEGQKFTNSMGDTVTAQADGSFKNERTGKSTPGSSVKSNVGGVRSGVSTGSDGVKRSYNTSTNRWEVVG